jgi:hypothetical protein
MPFTQSCSVPICSTVPSEKPSIPNHVAEYVSCEELRVRVGITQLPVTLLANPFVGEDMFDTVAYPLQFVLVPALVLMFGREEREVLASLTAKTGFTRTRATSTIPALVSLPQKICLCLGIAFGFRMQCEFCSRFL